MCWRRSRFSFSFNIFCLPPDPRPACRAGKEDEKLLQLRGQQGKSFAKIAGEIDGRSYNDVKNRWSQISRQIAALKVTTRVAFFFSRSQRTCWVLVWVWRHVVCAYIWINFRGFCMGLADYRCRATTLSRAALVADRPPDRCPRGDSSSRQIADSHYCRAVFFYVRDWWNVATETALLTIQILRRAIVNKTKCCQ